MPSTATTFPADAWLLTTAMLEASIVLSVMKDGSYNTSSGAISQIPHNATHVQIGPSRLDP